MYKTPPTVLCIAGTDPTAGAGLLADLRVCREFEVYGMGVITAVTFQNTVGVRGYRPMQSDDIRAQLSAVLDDIRPDAVKVGMLPTVDAVNAVADAIGWYKLDNVIVDPVMVATSGDSLSTGSAVEAICRRLLPLATLTTPNIPETERLSGIRIRTDGPLEHVEHDCAEAARLIIARHGGRNVLIKSGHLQQYHTTGRAGECVSHNDSHVIDRLYRQDGSGSAIRHRWVDTDNTHGTGCSLSSAIAACLAKGYTLTNAVQHAADWMSAALADGAVMRLGHGHGPAYFNHTIPLDKRQQHENQG